MANRGKRERSKIAEELFDFSGSDPELLRSGRIPDPHPEHTGLFRWLAEVLGNVEEFLRARGGTSLRMGIRVFWGLIAAVGIFLLVGPIINKPMDFDEVIASAEFKDVEWVAQNASFDYEVSRDDDGNFRTTVREGYTANFVNGAESTVTRRIVTEVHGHDAMFELESATIDGVPADAKVTGRATTTDIVLRPPSGDKFDGTYEIEMVYSLRDLIEDTDDSVTGDAMQQWQWPVFAPSWTQATKGLEVSVALERELDDELLRKPYATVGWLLVSGNVWMEPDEVTDEWVTYSFTNDDSLPPNSDVWLRFDFTDGTFTQPAQTTLFWVQTWGPLIPLAVLLVLMLFALAARWVVWADSAGEPWFVVRNDPPDDLSPTLAAQLLGKPRHAELVSTLAEPTRGHDAAENTHGRKRKSRRRKWSDGARQQLRHSRWLQAVAWAGRRAGRVGNLPSAMRWSTRWAGDTTVVDQGLRWKPDSYVRDTFIFAPIAVTMLQWGILRQLSEQFILLIVWWPFAFVAASTIIAGIAVWAVRKPRPLTRKGALTVQQLKGIDVWARGTRLLDRGPVDDPLLPYAVLTESPRAAGNAVIEQVVQETGERRIVDGWRTQHFLSIPSMLAFVATLALFAGSIVLVSTLPTPYGSNEYLTWPSSVSKGAIWTQTEGFEIEAEISRDDDGAARLEVVERHSVQFTPGGSSVPQFEREWQTSRYGQDLGLVIKSVRVDGAEVKYHTVDGQRTRALATQLSEPLSGVYDVEIRYALTNPSVEVSDGGEGRQQVRWSGLLWFWDDTFYTDGDAIYDGTSPVRPLRVQFTIPPDLVDDVASGGWIGYGDPDNQPYERGSGFHEWEYSNTIYVDGPSGKVGDSTRYELRIGDVAQFGDGALVMTLDADNVKSRVDEWEEGDTSLGAFEVDSELNETFGQHELAINGDLGVTLNFKDDTFTKATAGGLIDYRVSYQLPLMLVIALTVLAIGASVGVFLYLKKRARLPSASVLLTSMGTILLLAVAQSVVFWWVTGTMAGSDVKVGLLIASSLLMWVTVIGQWIVLAATGSTKRTTKNR
ncbi:DUF2207 domain-containing protein [Leucobacter denitrificans]|uniref:DUF2207 domain-containing protein n=1 Tax=Leucobacter denitrificans TaxID=683042 RepID=A0A7G9S2M9_9MICO|nr:DUF2207 domain-containing protein [Leucobacter denitrificans]QNN62104.1 DUF2207 domain-containing protein [Leucobacter denitrificans]